MIKVMTLERNYTKDKAHGEDNEEPHAQALHMQSVTKKDIKCNSSCNILAQKLIIKFQETNENNNPFLMGGVKSD